MKVFISVHVLMFVICECCGSTFQVQKNDDSDVARHQLEQIYKQTKHMKYGKCWTRALEELHTGCRNLSDETQRRIAYAFARCHLQSAGRDVPECPSHRPVSECTSEEVLKDTAFNTYTEFFTHTQQICFHLQSQVWHEATENTISRLAANSADVASSLEQSSELAQEMIARQNVTLKNQEELLRHERLLRENMHQSVLDVQRSHEETKNVIREQRVLFLEVFDRVATLQKTVLGEFTSIYSFCFYVGAVFLCYIITSTRRTESARIWLFVLLTFNFVAEKLIVQYHMTPAGMVDGVPDNTVLPETVYADMWLCRKVFTGIALVTMLACVIRFKDYNKMNNELLNDIKRQNNVLQELLKEHGNAGPNSSKTIEVPESLNATLPIANGFDDGQVAVISSATPGGQDLLLNSLPSPAAVLDQSFATTASVYTHYDSDNDRTFLAEDESSRDSSYSSYQSASGSSRRSSLALGGLSAMIRSSTPSRGEDLPSLRKSRSRRSSVSSDLSIVEQLKENVEEVQGVIVGGYNLRKRRSMQPMNPILERESSADFARAVAKVTMRRRDLFQ